MIRVRVQWNSTSGETYYTDAESLVEPMMKKSHFSGGSTSLKRCITVAIFAVVAATFLHFLPSQAQFTRHMKVRQQITQDSRVCADTIVQRLRNGKARTLLVTSPNGAPNSRADFVLQVPLASGATAYALLIWHSGGNIYGQEFPLGGTQGLHQPRFQCDDFELLTLIPTDPGLINVSLQLKAPYDDSATILPTCCPF